MTNFLYIAPGCHLTNRPVEPLTVNHLSNAGKYM